MKRKLRWLVGAVLAGAVVPGGAMAGERAGPAADDRGAVGAAFTPPGAPMVLTRELRKTLVDGQSFVSRRRYAIRFVSEGEGWRVEGTLLASEVEAPADVPAALVELERTRSDEGLFPLRLDRAGLIVSQQGSQDPHSSARALAAAQSYLATAPLSSADRSAASALTARLQAQTRAAGGNWPTDLFRPAPGERSEVRRIPLGGGADGKVTVTMAAAGSPAGVLERLERRVVTETAGSRRLSVETWTLARAR